MPITRTPIVDDDGSGRTGTVIDNAWKQQFYDQIDAIVGPATGATVGPIVVTPFNAGDYTGSGGMPWTVTAGNVSANWYQLVGRMLTWNIAIAGSVVSGTPFTSLNVKLPAALTATQVATAYGKVYQGPTGWIDVALTANVNLVGITKIDNTNFALDSNTWLRYQMHIPV